MFEDPVLDSVLDSDDDLVLSADESIAVGCLLTDSAIAPVAFSAIATVSGFSPTETNTF